MLWALFPLCEQLPLAIFHGCMVSLQWNGTVPWALGTSRVHCPWIMNADCSCFPRRGTASCLRSLPSSFMMALSLPFLEHGRLSCVSSSALFSLKLCLLWFSYWTDLQVCLRSLSPAWATAKVCRTSVLCSQGHMFFQVSKESCLIALGFTSCLSLLTLPLVSGDFGVIMSSFNFLLSRSSDGDGAGRGGGERGGRTLRFLSWSVHTCISAVPVASTSLSPCEETASSWTLTEPAPLQSGITQQ